MARSDEALKPKGSMIAEFYARDGVKLLPYPEDLDDTRVVNGDTWVRLGQHNGKTYWMNQSFAQRQLKVEGMESLRMLTEDPDFPDYKRFSVTHFWNLTIFSTAKNIINITGLA